MKCAKVLLYIWLTVISSTTVYGGSRVVFESTPQQTNKLTDSLAMRCSLHDTSQVGSLVGRDVTGKSNNTHVSSLVNVQSISSIIVMHDGVDVASLMQSSGPRKLSNSSNLQVSGNMTSSGDEKGHLLLTWSDPSSVQAGEYTCEINGIDDIGHNIQLSIPIQVDYVSPTVDDLVNYIKEMKIEVTDLKEMKTKVSDLERRLNRSQHIESGTIQCGDSNTWTGRDGSWDFKDIQQSFQSIYEKPPRVMLHVWEVHDNQAYTVWAVDLKNVDLTGFNVRCRTWHGFVFHRLNLTWISIPDMS